MPGPRNHWRFAFLALLGVWILSVGVLGYAIVDQGITNTYASVSYDESHALIVMKRLAPALQGRDKRVALLELLRDQNPKGFIVATDSTVDIDGLVFIFGRNGRLTTVK